MESLDLGPGNAGLWTEIYLGAKPLAFLAQGQQAIPKCPLIISNEIALTLIPSYMGSCHGQILIETETDTLLGKLGTAGVMKSRPL